MAKAYLKAITSYVMVEDGEDYDTVIELDEYGYDVLRDDCSLVKIVKEFVEREKE